MTSGGEFLLLLNHRCLNCLASVSIGSTERHYQQLVLKPGITSALHNFIVYLLSGRPNVTLECRGRDGAFEIHASLVPATPEEGTFINFDWEAHTGVLNLI